ncbi:MAG: DUF1018 domain-containing protein [Campylobacter sp.]|nr:DUF1018 domain-containing protein [Campylobacter sp.]
MTEKQRVLRNNLLKRIHLNSEYKLLRENDAWEMWLEIRFGVSSSANLSINELKLALDMLINGDFKKSEPDILGRNLVKNSKLVKKDDKKITLSQYNYLKSLAKRLNFSDERLVRWVAKQCSIIIRLESQLKNILSSDAKKAITGLEKMCKFYRK